MARFFLDTEFIDNGKTIKLISIALIREDGASYYAVAKDGWSPDDCDEWMRANVLSKLPPKACWLPRVQIRDDIHIFLFSGEGTPEIWAYFADYDWVAFCQLFGRMVDLPSGIPMYCRDLKQEMDRFGVTKAMLQIHDAKYKHNALLDAEWVRSTWLHLFGEKIAALTPDAVFSTCATENRPQTNALSDDVLDRLLADDD